MQLRINGVHCRESTGTVPVVLKVLQVTMSAAFSVVPMDHFYAPLFSHTHHWCVCSRTTCMWDTESIGGGFSIGATVQHLTAVIARPISVLRVVIVVNVSTLLTRPSCAVHVVCGRSHPNAAGICLDITRRSTNDIASSVSLSNLLPSNAHPVKFIIRAFAGVRVNE